MKKVLLVLLLAFSASTIMPSCASKNTGKTKGRQQPKKGRMPCPMKDC